MAIGGNGKVFFVGMSGQIKLLREDKTRLELVNEELKKQMQDQEETMGNMVKRLDILEEENSALQTKTANWDRDLDARMTEMFDRRFHLQVGHSPFTID